MSKVFLALLVVLAVPMAQAKHAKKAPAHKTHHAKKKKSHQAKAYQEIQWMKKQFASWDKMSPVIAGKIKNKKDKDYFASLGQNLNGTKVYPAIDVFVVEEGGKKVSIKKLSDKPYKLQVNGRAVSLNPNGIYESLHKGHAALDFVLPKAHADYDGELDDKWSFLYAVLDGLYKNCQGFVQAVGSTDPTVCQGANPGDSDQFDYNTEDVVKALGATELTCHSGNSGQSNFGFDVVSNGVTTQYSCVGKNAFCQKSTPPTDAQKAESNKQVHEAQMDVSFATAAAQKAHDAYKDEVFADLKLKYPSLANDIQESDFEITDHTVFKPDFLNRRKGSEITSLRNYSLPQTDARFAYAAAMKDLADKHARLDGLQNTPGPMVDVKPEEQPSLFAISACCADANCRSDFWVHSGVDMAPDMKENITPTSDQQ